MGISFYLSMDDRIVRKIVSSERKDKFLSKIVERLSIESEEVYAREEFLKETCEFFSISHGFIYEVDPRGWFAIKDNYVLPQANGLEVSLDLQDRLGRAMLSELSSQKVIIVEGNQEKYNELELRLKEIFQANILILIPILNQHYELSAILGISDLRKEIRDKEIDIKSSCAVLSLLAEKVKIEMFQKGIQNAEHVLKNVLNHVGIDIYVNDYYTHDILYVNDSMAAPYGGVANMMGKKCYKAIFTDKEEQCEFCPQPRLLDENENPSKTYSWDYERQMDGSWFRVFSSAMPWTDGRIAHVVASVDITENKKNELAIEKIALYDHLTGLANLRSLHDDLDLVLDASKRLPLACYLIYVDLDGFKPINDTIGHRGGDELLKSIGLRLNQLPREHMRCYRQGGDEFVILMRDYGDKKDLKDTVQSLAEIFCDVYHFEGHEVQCGCSMGIAHFPSSAECQKSLVHFADMAMYEAKKIGQQSVRVYQKGECVSLEHYLS